MNTVNLDLGHSDLVALIVGGWCPYHNMGQPYVERGLVTHVGGFRDSWDWNAEALRSLSIMQLVALRKEISALKPDRATTIPAYKAMMITRPQGNDMVPYWKCEDVARGSCIAVEEV